jgi:hypothetical protein
MVTTTGESPTWDLLRDSGEPRPIASTRTDVVMTVLSVWFTLGLFLDAYAHANIPNLETFFTPWHAVFYSGFAVTAGWVLWTIWGYVKQGRRGKAAVPVGYGMTAIALPVFAVSGGLDLMWHTLIGIETTTNIFFSPSHLGLITSMIIILTSPLRAAWARYEVGARPSLGAVLPAMLTLAFAVSLVLLFLTYGNAMTAGASNVVESLSTKQGQGVSRIASSIVITNVVLLAPLLLVIRRWQLPRGTATIVFGLSALISSVLSGFRNLDLCAAVLVAGVLVDVLAAVLAPSGSRRTAFWLFGALAAFVTWAVYILASSAFAGHLPAVTEFWTGIPVVAGLVGWLLAALMLPNALPAPERDPHGTASAGAPASI